MRSFGNRPDTVVALIGNLRAATLATGEITRTILLAAALISLRRASRQRTDPASFSYTDFRSSPTAGER